jgi:uncharacterized membrane protein
VTTPPKDLPSEDTLSAYGDRVKAETSPAERVVFFSDAVVAIAITLLALDLPLPRTTDSTTNGQMLHALGAGWPSYLAFIISFLVIGNHWGSHRRVFKYAEHVNARINSLNMVWLLMMILIPFAARLLASNGGFGIRFTIYSLVQVIAVGCQMLISRELHRSRLLRPDAPEVGARRDLTFNVVFIAAFLLSIPVSFATNWAFALWAAFPLVIRVIRAVRAYKAPRT